VDYLKDIGVISIILTGTALIFKFLLDAFKANLERLHEQWKTEADRMYSVVKEVRDDNKVQDKKLDDLAEEVSEVRNELNGWGTKWMSSASP